MSSLFEEAIDESIFDDAVSDVLFAVSEELLPPRESNFYISNQVTEKLFLDFTSNKNMPHAVILSGAKGMGKATFAYRLSRFLLKYGSEADAGDSLFGDAAPAILPETMDMDADDPVFRRVLSGGHPDFLSLEPLEGKKGLDVEQIRKVAPFLRKTASEAGGWRIVLIDDADTMNRNAQNALLKILEEPPKQTLLILVTHNQGAFLPTIQSRCRLVTIPSLSYEDYEMLLKRFDPSIEARNLNFLHEYSSASVGKSISFIEYDGLELFEKILAQLGSLPNLDFEAVHLFCEQFGRGVKEQNWQNLKDIFLWMFQSITLSKAKNTELPSSLTSLKIFAAAASLEDLMKICEMLQDHFTRADRGNLDKRQATLEAFMMIDRETNL